MLYIDCINMLSDSLNFKSTDTVKAKENKQIFLNAVLTLKNEFKTTVSTKFLMGFVVGDKKQKSNRVNYMLKSVGLNDRQKEINFFLDSIPSLSIKEDNELYFYKSFDDGEGNEKISLKVVPMTSHDYKGVKAPCKVGVYAKRFKLETLNNIIV